MTQFDGDKGTIDGRPAVDKIEREQQAQRDLYAALDGMSVDAAERTCAWVISRMKQDAAARVVITAIDALKKRSVS